MSSSKLSLSYWHHITHDSHTSLHSPRPRPECQFQWGCFAALSNAATKCSGALSVCATARQTKLRRRENHIRKQKNQRRLLLRLRGGLGSDICLMDGRRTRVISEVEEASRYLVVYTWFRVCGSGDWEVSGVHFFIGGVEARARSWGVRKHESHRPCITLMIMFKEWIQICYQPGKRASLTSKIT